MINMANEYRENQTEKPLPLYGLLLVFVLMAIVTYVALRWLATTVPTS